VTVSPAEDCFKKGTRFIHNYIMTSLPSIINVAHKNSIIRIHDAYNECLRLEKTLQELQDKGENATNNLVYVRILGYLIHFAPGDSGIETVVQQIISCHGDDSKLLSVGQMYYDHYIRACKFNEATYSMYQYLRRSQFEPEMAGRQRLPATHLILCWPTWQTTA